MKITETELSALELIAESICLDALSGSIEFTAEDRASQIRFIVKECRKPSQSEKEIYTDQLKYKQLKKERGLTSNYISNMTDIHPTTLSSIINGNLKATLKQKNKLDEFFNI